MINKPEQHKNGSIGSIREPTIKRGHRRDPELTLCFFGSLFQLSLAQRLSVFPEDDLFGLLGRGIGGCLLGVLFFSRHVGCGCGLYAGY